MMEQEGPHTQVLLSWGSFLTLPQRWPTLGQQDPRPWLPWWRPVGVSGPAEEASPGQSPSLGTGLQGAHTVLWALEKLRTEKASWGQRRTGSPRPCQQPLHRVCRGQKGRVRQCGFLHLSLQPPAGAERWSSSFPRRGDEAVTGSQGNRCP